MDKRDELLGLAERKCFNCDGTGVIAILRGLPDVRSCGFCAGTGRYVFARAASQNRSATDGE